MIIIDENLCKGCHLCLFMCHANIYAISSEINKKGVQLPFVKFEERCSRSTTVGRVLAHLVPNGDFQGKNAVKEGQYIEVYPVGEYQIDLKFDRKQV